jgi:hypothetical protein
MSSKGNYEYFSGTPQSPAWSSNRSDSRPVFEDPNGVGWNVAVSYNAGLQRYLLTTEHIKSHAGYIGIFDAPEAWGPWTTVHTTLMETGKALTILPERAMAPFNPHFPFS